VVRNFFRNLPYWAVDFWKLGPKQMLKRILRKTKNFFLGIALRLHMPVKIDLENIIEDVAGIPEEHQRLMEIHVRAVLRYHPDPYEGKVTLFRVRGQSLFGGHDEDNGWNKLVTGGVDLRIINGAHRNILEQPHVGSLAQGLRDVLDQAIKGEAKTDG
jgi:thioesterase domain-containing protein